MKGSEWFVGWVTGHLPLSAGVGLAVAETTKSPALGLVAASAAHYALDTISPFPKFVYHPNQPRFMNWLGVSKNFRVVATIDCLVAWTLVTIIGLYFQQSGFFWLMALMGFWPDLGKVPFVQKLFQAWPLNWFEWLHEKTHWWKTSNGFVAISGWTGEMVASYLFLLWVVF